MTQQTDLAVIQAAAVLTYGHPNSNDPTETPLITVLELLQKLQLVAHH